MKIIRGEYPPRITEIAMMFPQARMGPVLFAWGYAIYDPTNALPREDVWPWRVHDQALVAHEEAHAAQQRLMEVNVWWDRYLDPDDMTFRLEQEVDGHAAEYEFLMDHGSRPERRRALRETARKLASPLYGFGITRAQAERYILDYAAA